MGLATLLRGFKAPLAALNRFFESNGVMPTLGYPPRYDRLQLPGDDETLGPQTALLRTKLAGTPTGAADIHSQNIRIFMPNKEDMDRATHAYVSYANLSVFSQRQIDVTAELLDKTPPDFAKLRSEILGFAREDEESLLRIAGMQPAKEEQNLAGMLFLVVSNEREYSEKGTFLREVNFPVPLL